MSKKTAIEILKVNRLVNIISIILMVCIVIGWVLVMGFIDDLYLPGIIIGFVLAFLPITWFSWLNKIGWDSKESERKIRIAKRTLYLEYIEKSETIAKYIKESEAKN